METAELRIARCKNAGISRWRKIELKEDAKLMRLSVGTFVVTRYSIHHSYINMYFNKKKRDIKTLILSFSRSVKNQIYDIKCFHLINKKEGTERNTYK